METPTFMSREITRIPPTGNYGLPGQACNITALCNKTLPLKCTSVTKRITFIRFLSDSSKLIDGALALSYNFIVLDLISYKGSCFYYY